MSVATNGDHVYYVHIKERIYVFGITEN